MVTTTTSCFRATLVPSYQGEDPEPVLNPPPWIQNITGRFALSSPGVQTFRIRQSSLCGSGRPAYRLGYLAGARTTGVPFPCGVCGPYARASRTPAHGLAGLGGMNRPELPVSSPYGMPLK